MKKIKFSLLVCMSFSLLFFNLKTFALSYTRYKDITYISIKTNFSFDYDSLSEDGVPDITFNSDGNTDDNVYVAANGKYTIESAEWYQADTDSFTLGSEPRVVVYLQTADYPNNPSANYEYYYRFMSSYSQSSCYISNATFVSAQRISNEYLKVIFKLRGIKGTYNPPSSAYWADDRGLAVWEPDNVLDSGYYDLVLYRDNTSIAHIDKYHGTTYNFYQYMTKTGEYSFKVRTVAGTDNQATFAKRSEYTESPTTTIDQSNVSNGTSQSSQNNNGLNVGFVKQNGVWYFYSPNGQMIRNNWTKWNNKWYYFDTNGVMQTGFITVGGEQYFLNSDGEMLVGWLRSGDSYYYFDTTVNQHYGAMCKNTWILYDNKYFYFDNNGVMVTGWRTILDSNNNQGYYYFYPAGTTNGLYGYMATNTKIDGFNIGADGKWTGG